jgi:predicted PurR-regulated permease PerM
VTEGASGQTSSGRAGVAPPPAPSSGKDAGWALAEHPFRTGFWLATGAFASYWLIGRVLDAHSVLLLIVVSLFLAFGLNPPVEFFMRHGLKRSRAVVVVALVVIAVLALFILAIVPVIADQVSSIAKAAPQWFDELQKNEQIKALDDKYDLVDKAKDYVLGGDLAKRVFGGVLGVGLAVLGALANVFVVLVMTVYFQASLPQVKRGLYRLAPASSRARVAELGDQILDGIGGYVSGAFVVAVCAGLSTLVFLFIVGLGKYAVALAFVVALLDVIPMIGATLGAVVVCAIAAAVDVKTGIFCVIFYIVYQQLENYVIYPRVMSKSVDIPGVMTVIAALIGASLLGVIGALLAIPTAAAILLLMREVVVRRQDAQ